MEIYKMMVMSTGHISKTTANLLTEEAVGIIVYQKAEYGWFIVVTDWKDSEEHIPEDLKECLSLAEKNDCDWLCLDCDGEIYSSLPVYNWNEQITKTLAE